MPDAPPGPCPRGRRVRVPRALLGEVAAVQPAPVAAARFVVERLVAVARLLARASRAGAFERALPRSASAKNSVALAAAGAGWLRPLSFRRSLR